MKLLILKGLLTTYVSLILLSALGCNNESVGSDNIKTAGIWASMEARASEGGTRVNVELNVGGSNGTNLELSTNEYLQASNAGTTIELSKDFDFLDIDYQGYFSNNDSNALFSVVFVREDGTRVSGSRANLPTYFDITQPENNETFPFNGQVDLTWGPAIEDGRINFESRLSCRTLSGSTTTRSLQNNAAINDDGIYTIVFADSAAFASGTSELNTQIPCNVKLTLSRISSGTVSSEFESGSRFRAIQTRSVEFLLDLSR